MFHTQNDIRASLIEAGINKADADLLAQHARPAVWLETREVDDEADIPIGATKLGGRPDLPAGVAWPVRPAYPDAGEEVAETFNEMASQVNDYASAVSLEPLKEAMKETLETFASQFSPEECDALLATIEEGHKRMMSPEHQQLMANIAETASAEAQARQAIMQREAPLSFIAQINFSELWAAGPLDADMPGQGVLSLFFDVVAQPWGGDAQDRIGYAVLFHDTDVGLTRRDVPEALQSNEGNCFPPVACTLHACMTPLPCDTAHYDLLRLPPALAEQLNEWQYPDDGSGPHAMTGGEDWQCHHIGGWPTPVQGDMQVECALVNAGHSYGNSDAYTDPALAAIRATATDWLLLAQIGSDDSKSNMMWGDDGQLYLWIRRDDLKARRFENTWLILQCY